MRAILRRCGVIVGPLRLVVPQLVRGRAQVVRVEDAEQPVKDPPAVGRLPRAEEVVEGLAEVLAAGRRGHDNVLRVRGFAGGARTGQRGSGDGVGGRGGGCTGSCGMGSRVGDLSAAHLQLGFDVLHDLILHRGRRLASFRRHRGRGRPGACQEGTPLTLGFRLGQLLAGRAQSACVSMVSFGPDPTVEM